MDINIAITMGGELLDRHGLTDWTLVIDSRPLARCGLCNFSYREIHISQVHVIDEGEEDVRDTILHEIAHALVGPSHGHSHVWRAKCIEIGAKPDRLFSKRRTRRFIAKCPSCGKEYQKQRKPIETRVCGACHSQGLPAILWFDKNPLYVAAALRRAQVKHGDKGVSGPIQSLLIQLQHADKKRAKKIRSKLRSIGHFGGLK